MCRRNAQRAFRSMNFGAQFKFGWLRSVTNRASDKRVHVKVIQKHSKLIHLPNHFGGCLSGRMVSMLKRLCDAINQPWNLSKIPLAKECFMFCKRVTLFSLSLLIAVDFTRWILISGIRSDWLAGVNAIFHRCATQSHFAVWTFVQLPYCLTFYS